MLCQRAFREWPECRIRKLNKWPLQRWQTFGTRGVHISLGSGKTDRFWVTLRTQPHTEYSGNRGASLTARITTIHPHEFYLFASAGSVRSPSRRGDLPHSPARWNSSTQKQAEWRNGVRPSSGAEASPPPRAQELLGPKAVLTFLRPETAAPRARGNSSTPKQAGRHDGVRPSPGAEASPPPRAQELLDAKASRAARRGAPVLGRRSFATSTHAGTPRPKSSPFVSAAGDGRTPRAQELLDAKASRATRRGAPVLGRRSFATPTRAGTPRPKSSPFVSAAGDGRTPAALRSAARRCSRTPSRAGTPRRQSKPSHATGCARPRAQKLRHLHSRRNSSAQRQSFRFCGRGRPHPGCALLCGDSNLVIQTGTISF